ALAGRPEAATAAAAESALSAGAGVTSGRAADTAATAATGGDVFSRTAGSATAGDAARTPRVAAGAAGRRPDDDARVAGLASHTVGRGIATAATHAAAGRRAALHNLATAGAAQASPAADAAELTTGTAGAAGRTVAAER